MKISFHKEHTAIQICTVTQHKGKHASHKFTTSNQNISMKGQQVFSCFGATVVNIGNRGRTRRVRVRGGGRGRPKTGVSEIQAPLVDHGVNHGLTMRRLGKEYN